MNVLYLGGTGEISYACVLAGAAIGQHITVLNRGQNDETLPDGVRRVTGDLSNPAAYHAIADARWDAVCQFRAYHPDEVRRDVEFFKIRTAQYVFISSASAYQKTLERCLITELTPLENPHWGYSRNKAECERILMEAHRAGTLPVTIVRPSHTYRRRFPTAVGDGDHIAWRMKHRKPVIVHGDGTSLWTCTHADDFARVFVRLLGNPQAIGESFHITQHLNAYPWDRLIRAMAAAVGVAPNIVHVPSDTLARYHPDWTGPLFGDKAWPVLFDNTKVMNATGEKVGTIDPETGFAQVADHWRGRSDGFAPDPVADALHDRIAADQSALGAG